jgi:hypothetical protein
VNKNELESARCVVNYTVPVHDVDPIIMRVKSTRKVFFKFRHDLEYTNRINHENSPVSLKLIVRRQTSPKHNLRSLRGKVMCEKSVFISLEPSACSSQDPLTLHIEQGIDKSNQIFV